MLNDHYEAAWRQLNKLTEGQENRAEILEFASVIYKAASQMHPMYKYVGKTLTRASMQVFPERADEDGLFHNNLPSVEDFAKEVFSLYQSSGLTQKMLPREVPKGTMEALDEVLQDEAVNLELKDRMTPYKELQEWALLPAAVEQTETLIKRMEAEAAEATK